MSNGRPPAKQPHPNALTRRPVVSDGAMPRSPAEALEPTRGPTRPRGKKVRREARRLSPFLRAINGFLTLVTVLLLLGGGAYLWFESEIDRAGPLMTAKTVVVREREGSRDIAQRLETEGVVASHHVFVAHYIARTLGSWFGGRPLNLKAGEYQFEPGQSIREVTEAIAKGRSVLFSFTIPEGLTSWQIMERLKADSALTGEMPSTPPPEGSLMPDTYRVPRGMARTAVIELMQAEQKKLLEKLWEQRQPDLPVKTIAEALVLASIVEKETGKRDERERVAAVFVNRLKQGIRLQSDPTILYGLSGSKVQWGKPITRSDIASKTAHNTYQIPALPPTPICNPGRLSIAATLQPAQTKELYFVADGNGGHVFSETLKDHNAAVGNWRKVEKDIRARQAEKQSEAQQGAAAAAAPTVLNSPAAAPVAASAAAAATKKQPPQPQQPKKQPQ